MGKFKVTLFDLQKFTCRNFVHIRKNLNKKVWKSENLDFKKLQKILQNDLKAEYIAKRTKNLKLLSNIMKKKWKSWMLMAVSKIKSL